MISRNFEKTPRTVLLVGLVTGVMAGLCLDHGHAAIYTWDGGGANNLFSTAGNWNPNTAPPSLNGHDFRFGALESPFQNTANVDQTGNPSSFVFNAGAPAMTISGNFLQFATGTAAPIVNNSNNLQTFNNEVRQFWITGAANRTWTAASGNLEFSNAVWRPDSSVSDTLQWTLNGGSNGLITGAITNPGTWTGKTVDVVKADGGMWTLQGSLPASVTRNVTVNGGTLVLGGANTLSGATSVTSGILRLDNVNAIQGTSGVTVASGATLRAGVTGTYANVPLTISGNGFGGNPTAALLFQQNSGTHSWQGPITLAGNARIGAYAAFPTVNLQGAIGGAGNLELWGGGGDVTHLTTYNLSAPSNYTGNTTISAEFGSSTSVVLASGDNRLPVGTAVTLRPTWNVGIYAELVLDGNSQEIAGLTNTGSGTARIRNGSATESTLTINNPAAYSFSGILGGPGTNDNNFALVKDGVGLLTLTGTNSYLGDTTVIDGTLSISNAYLADMADVYLTTGATLDLAFAGADTIDQLFFDGIAQAPGTWGSVGSGADFESSFFTSNGLLNVTGALIPEPSSVLLSVIGLLAITLYSLRRRK